MIALPRSLTARVTALFVLIVALAAVGLGAYLYGVLVDEIVRRDDSQLRGKLRQIQTVLSRPGAAELLRTQPDFFRDTMSGQENSLVRIVAADGAVLADINAGGERYPVPAPAAIAGHAGAPPGGAIIDWRSSRGEAGRVIAGAANLGQAEVTVVVARLYGERSAMLAQYRQRIAGAAAVSALVAALCAAGMLHRGLRPLRRMARHAALLRPGTLAQPLEVPGAPSELQPLIDALNAMQTRLHEGYERLSGFSADLAHEFRTPVTNLLGQSQVMLAQPRSIADYEQLIASNIEEFERLARMIESILFLARAGQDDVLLARQPLPALDTLHKVADFYEGLAGERGVQIVCTGDAVVLADPHLLLRALANLVSNALRYAEPGSSVVLQALAQQGSTAISVTNQGAPIAPAHLPHLFERFYRADAARSHGDGSTGLGLAIVSAIMALHRGMASVRSDAGGTCFTLTFHAAVTDPSSTV